MQNSENANTSTSTGRPIRAFPEFRTARAGRKTRKNRVGRTGERGQPRPIFPRFPASGRAGTPPKTNRRNHPPLRCATRAGILGAPLPAARKGTRAGIPAPPALSLRHNAALSPAGAGRLRVRSCTLRRLPAIIQASASGGVSGWCGVRHAASGVQPGQQGVAQVKRCPPGKSGGSANISGSGRSASLAGQPLRGLRGCQHPRRAATSQPRATHRSGSPQKETEQRPEAKSIGWPSRGRGDGLCGPTSRAQPSGRATSPSPALIRFGRATPAPPRSSGSERKTPARLRRAPRVQCPFVTYLCHPAHPTPLDTRSDCHTQCHQSELTVTQRCHTAQRQQHLHVGVAGAHGLVEGRLQDRQSLIQRRPERLCPRHQ